MKLVQVGEGEPIEGMVSTFDGGFDEAREK